MKEAKMVIFRLAMLLTILKKMITWMILNTEERTNLYLIQFFPANFHKMVSSLLFLSKS